MVVQNSDPFTYLRSRPIRVAEGAGLDSGSLAMAVLKHATVLELATLIPRLFSARPRTLLRHGQVEGQRNVLEAQVTALDGHPFPVHVDGDYLGDFERVEYGMAPGGLLAVA